MTKPKAITETKRPWRAAGQALREALRCPLCATNDLKVIAYRTRTTRLECANCKFRFSVNPLDVANTLRMRPGAVVEGQLASLSTKHAGRLGAMAVMAGASSEGDMLPAIKRDFQNLGTTVAAGVLAKPRDTPEERKQRLRPLTGLT